MTATGGLVPPIHVASTFVRDADNQYRRGYCYGRADNATVRQVEGVLTDLEGGAATLLFGSGMAAATTAFLALEQPAHVDRADSDVLGTAAMAGGRGAASRTAR